MWYKVRELQSKGLNKTQIGKHLGVDRSTVRRYLRMSREEFCKEAGCASQIHAETGRIRGVCAGDSGGISVYIGRTDA